jgi:hypothetical protein
MAEHLSADQAGDHRDGGQDADIADIQPLDRRRLGVDPLPLGEGDSSRRFTRPTRSDDVVPGSMTVMRKLLRES